MDEDNLCDLCKDEEDTTEHLFLCPRLGQLMNVDIRLGTLKNPSRDLAAFIDKTFQRCIVYLFWYDVTKKPSLIYDVITHKQTNQERSGQENLVDDQDMIELEDHLNSEEDEAEDDYDEENGTGKAEDELILKADSDIDKIQEDDTNGSTGREASVETRETPQTKRDTEFTSEDFKIELRGLPRYYAMGQLKKLLNETLPLKAHKIKPAGSNKDWAYVTFRDEKSRTKALTVLDEFKWKKCVLSCSITKPVEDPVQAKRAADSKLLE
ncbi:uncharacterized protein [Palaemon carinicauda]|uniref:uncharacterized protein n=1 Tax=Palaemon carinicauda TaxID=392227 RepID=UPI0035B68D20